MIQLGWCSNNCKPLTPEVRLNERKSTKCSCVATFTFGDSIGDMIFPVEHNNACKPIKIKIKWIEKM